MTWESDIAPELTRAEFVLSAMKAIASWPNATAEAVCSAAIAANDQYLRARLIAFANIEPMGLSVRNALLKALFEVE